MINIQIDRLQLTLHGISASLAEAVVDGLQLELQRRLGVMKIGKGLTVGAPPVNIGKLSIAAIHEQTTLDVGTLRGMIADRLLDAIQAQLPVGTERGVI